MADGDISTLRVVGRYQQQNVVNTFHYLHTDQASDDKVVLRDLAIGWSTALKSDWLARHSTAYQLIGIKCFRHWGSSKTPGYLVVDEAGVVVADQVPSSLCRTITLYTADPNHRVRGRVMISGSNASMFDVTDGSVTTTELGLMTVLADALLPQIDYLTNKFDIVLPKAIPPYYTVVTDAKARVTPSSVTTRRVKQFLIG